jgi:hypothetical protein
MLNGMMLHCQSSGVICLAICVMKCGLCTEEPLAHMPEEGGRRDSLLQALQDELKLKNDEIKVKNAEIAILKKTVLLVFSVFVLGLVAEKLLMQ